VSARGKAAAVVTSAGILAAAWSAATLGGQTAVGAPAVAPDPTSLTSGDPSAAAVSLDASQTPGADPSASAAGQTSGAASSAAASSAASKAGTTAATSKAATTVRATTAAPASGLKDGTFAGPAVTHQYGSVAVSITVSGGKITSVTATTTSTSSTSTSITSSAVPTLKSRIIAAQSGSISTVSGATFTSTAFISSVQSAVTKAKV
jgi:uncharacterized protein with FMN-binding domain